ncbi:hypothetical protein BDQ17DRAFT_1320644 [Cyathus striatus]|nr:hypothetical protein BDQ17DRAFT_1320644 [Cyathus striatus]
MSTQAEKYGRKCMILDVVFQMFSRLDIYRGIFRFGVFNAIQSTCFDSIIYGCDNIVISGNHSQFMAIQCINILLAPTGSGKTVLFELAIIRLLKQAKDANMQLKSIYMAPTKATNLRVIQHILELVIGEMQRTRQLWRKMGKFNPKLKYILPDSPVSGGRGMTFIAVLLLVQTHILNEPRGSTLEVVISRMKRHGSLVRFLLVSATMPNIDDIASWIGSIEDQERPAQIYKFGEEFRPCKLTRYVIGVPRLRNQNDFVFTKNLDYKLFAILQQYSVGKPILVFCPTRKGGAFATADQLMKEYSEAEQGGKNLPWSHPSSVSNKSDLATFGIGVHHAGLAMNDRRLTEDLYVRKILRVLVSTSTLAVGVNLRWLSAHTVVIKGVRTFQGNASVEYSDLDIMQMLGRAGRPQFDKEGVAIILCEANLENKYKALVQGKTTLESSLHLNLSEYLNSEISLGTISDIDSAKAWLRSSFLFQRIRKNPNHYVLGMDDSSTWQERIDDVISKSVENLKLTKLIEEKDGQLVTTEYGDIMSKMAHILGLPERSTMREILETISNVEELCDSKMRASEKAIYNQLRKHADIRFELKKVEKTSDKVFLLLQAVLGGISLSNPEFKNSDSQPYLEAFSILRHAPRIARTVVEVAVVKKSGAQVKHGLELAWEDRPVVLRQIEHLGEKSIKVLAEHGITSLNHLRKQSPLRIETLLNRRPPFGLQVLAFVSELPQYTLNVSELREAVAGLTVERDYNPNILPEEYPVMDTRLPQLW